MASKQYSCTLCQEDSQDVQAVSWCPECETFLCLDCDRHHKKSKGTKHHATISVDAYRNLPDAVKSVSNMCTDHSQKQEFYCPKHACACCLQCVNDNHSRCGDVTHLTDIVKNIKSSERVVGLEVNLDCLKKDFDVIEKHMHGILNGAAADKSEGMSKIKTMRSEANKYMDIVEQTLVDKLNTEYENIRLETTNALEKVEESRVNITDTQTKLKSVVENATDLQVYNYLTNAEKINECELNNIRQLKSTKELEMVKIQVDISKGLSDFFQKMDNFGDIKIASSTSNLIFATSDTSASQSATKTSNTGNLLTYMFRR